MGGPRGVKGVRHGRAKAVRPRPSKTVPTRLLPSKTPPARPAGAAEQRRDRARKIVAALRKLYPDADCALHRTTALELLLATILSAQSTDETVNKVAPVLFARYPTAESLAAADAAEVQRIIHPTGFFRQKTKSIIGACRTIVERFGGQVPATMEELVQLPGVARKTANVLLGTWFKKNEGVVVDTHVGRLARRLDLTWSSKDEKDAVKIEQDLMQILPRKAWTYVAHALIRHGRRVCPARKPRCGECTLHKLCPAAFTFEPPDAKKARPKSSKSACAIVQHGRAAGFSPRGPSLREVLQNRARPFRPAGG